MEGRPAEDMWHLTIDDLLAAPAETPRLAGPGPFVISLSASTAPVSVPVNGFPEYPNLKVYEVKRNEDGRIRYRLRLGPIETDLEADAILSAVRERYPSAFAANAEEADLRVFKRTSSAAVAKEQPPAPVAEKPAPPPAEQVTCLSTLISADAPEPPKAKPPEKPQAKQPEQPKAKVVAAPAPLLKVPDPESGMFAIDFDHFLPPIEEHFKDSSAPKSGKHSGSHAHGKSSRHSKSHSHGKHSHGKPQHSKSQAQPKPQAAPQSPQMARSPASPMAAAPNSPASQPRPQAAPPRPQAAPPSSQTSQPASPATQPSQALRPGTPPSHPSAPTPHEHGSRRSRHAHKRAKGTAPSAPVAAPEKTVAAPAVATASTKSATPPVVAATGAVAPPKAAASPKAAQFVEPAHDPNAVTDQVAVLTLPADSAGEVDVDDAVESMILAKLDPEVHAELELELELELHRDPAPATRSIPKAPAPVAAAVVEIEAFDPAAVLAAIERPAPAPATQTRASKAPASSQPAHDASRQVPAVGAPRETVAALETVGDIETDVVTLTEVVTGIATITTRAIAQPELALQVPTLTEVIDTGSSGERGADLESIVARNNAMVDSLEAREVVASPAQDAAAAEAPPAAEVAELVLEDVEPIVAQRVDAQPVSAPVVNVSAPESEVSFDEIPLADLVVSSVEAPSPQASPGRVAASPVDGRDRAHARETVAAPLPQTIESAHVVALPAQLEVLEEAVQIEVVEPLVVAAPADEKPSTPDPIVEPVKSDATAASLKNPPRASTNGKGALSGRAVIDEPLVVEAAEIPDPVARPPVAGAQSRSGAPVSRTIAPPVEILADPLPEMDSTQTIRELTQLELADADASRWFAIQLSLTEEAANPEDVPHLDIFDAYRLYSVAGLDRIGFRHALRVGFFSDQGSAEMVAGYLRSYFDAPEVKRVSQAERDRFVNRRVVPKRDIGATGQHTIIELATAPTVPQRRLSDISSQQGKQASDSGSLWSRLVAPLKR